MIRFVENSRRGTCRQCGVPISLFEVPLAVDLHPDVTSQAAVGACLLELAHEAFERIIPDGLESRISVATTIRAS